MLLNNRYQVISTLGSGGFGETFLAQDTNMPSQRLCVVKKLKPVENNPQIYQIVQERFQREAAILEKLGSGSDQIPSLYAYFYNEGEFYLVQEWIEGDTLTANLKQHGLFTDRDIEDLLIKILPVLDYVHSQHIVHRDIKPDNIIIRYRDNKPVLIDFGAVRESMTTVLSSQGHPTSSIVIGTPGFMSSEQAAGRPIYSSDLYSLGLTAIYLLTGIKPQDLETNPQTGEINWRHLASHINPILAGVIDQAIAYHPKERFASARDMLAALQSQINTIPDTIPPTINFHNPVLVPAKQGALKSIVIASSIMGSIVGICIVIVQIFAVSFGSFSDTEVKISARRKNTTSEISGSFNEYEFSKTIVTPTPNINKITDNKNINYQDPKNINNSIKDDYLWLSQRQVTEADLINKSAYQLDIMRNTIYAVHGRRFDTPGLQDYFNPQSWYTPKYSPQDFPINLLSKLEIENAEFINQYQEKNNLWHFKR
jgi:serine/threonine-protein kinase